MSKSAIRWKMCSNAQKIQESDKLVKCNINTTGISNSYSKDNPTVIDSNNSKINYLIPGPKRT